jgi:hypothetical protein
MRLVSKDEFLGHSSTNWPSMPKSLFNRPGELGEAGLEFRRFRNSGRLKAGLQAEFSKRL